MLDLVPIKDRIGKQGDDRSMIATLVYDVDMFSGKTSQIYEYE